MILYAILSSCGMLTGWKFTLDWAMQREALKCMHERSSCNICRS